MYAIGVMPMPADFKYAEVMRRGKPQHERFDPFSIKHPKMDHGKRAKIFAPFDALRGLLLQSPGSRSFTWTSQS